MNKKIDLQLINIFFVIRSGSLQGNEASKKKDSEAGQIEAVEAMVVMMLQTHNNNFDDSNLTKIVLLTIISQISNFPILLWENKFPRPKKNLVKPQRSLVSPLVLTRIFGTFGRWRRTAPWRYLSQLRLMIRQLSPTQLCKFHVYIIHTLLLFIHCTEYIGLIYFYVYNLIVHPSTRSGQLKVKLPSFPEFFLVRNTMAGISKFRPKIKFSFTFLNDRCIICFVN